MAQLKILLAVTLLITTTPAAATAREKYVDFIERMATNPPAGVVYRQDLEAALVRLVNQERKKKSLGVLKINKDYLAAARAHAADLLQGNRMDHVASTGQNFESRMRVLHPSQMFMQRMAENAARVRRTKLSDDQKIADIIKQWLGSSSHRKTMVSRDYVSVSTGIAERDGVIYAVQIFSGPAPKTNLGGATIVAPPKEEGLY